MMSDYDVTLIDDNTADIYVIFHGPKDSVCTPRERARIAAHAILK